VDRLARHPPGSYGGVPTSSAKTPAAFPAGAGLLTRSVARHRPGSGVVDAPGLGHPR
jgi:hypothetical protein